MKTISAKPHEVKREWFVIDAEDKVLGRVAAEVASRLRGKHKPEYTPHVDTGDYIVIINADKVAVTGNKAKDKVYYHHTGYIGNMKKIQYKTLMAEKPEFALKKAVKGMLPDNSLGRKQLTRLRIFKDGEHTHEAQKPEVKEF